MLKKIKPYAVSIAIALAVGGLAALLTMDSMNIYETINKPLLSPPSILFPIVWTVLYILMGVSAAIVYVRGGGANDEAQSALMVYASQLAVNFLWSIVFFNLQAFGLAFVVLVVLWLLIILMIYKFYAVSPLAAYLQIPYLLWVTFAGYLNLMIVILN
ncbi:MAG: tryptophan-rich sensory protein [Clostridia bacterium]|nr:tryptophan-rich sensory protein [Clostridia bacterium]